MMALPKVFLKFLKREKKEILINFPYDPKFIPPIGSPMVFNGKNIGEIIKVNKEKSILTAIVKDKKFYEKCLKSKEPPSMGCRIIEEKED